MTQKQQREGKGRESFSTLEFQRDEISKLKQQLQESNQDFKQSELKCKDLLRREAISSSIIKQQKEELSQLRCGLEQPVRQEQNVSNQDFQAEKKQWETEKTELTKDNELLKTWIQNQQTGFCAQSARLKNDILIRDEELERRACIVDQCDKTIFHLQTLFNTQQESKQESTEILVSRMAQHEQMISILRNTVVTTKRDLEVQKAQAAEERKSHQAQIRQLVAEKEELLKQVQEPKFVCYDDENQAEEEWTHLQTLILMATPHQTQEAVENMLDDGEPEMTQQQESGPSCDEEKKEWTSTLKAALHQQEARESLQKDKHQRQPSSRTASKRKDRKTIAR